MTSLLQAAPAGHNNPPSDIDLLREGLQDNHAELLAAAERRILNAGKVPKVCKDDATAAKITDLLKLLANARQELEKKHKIEKDPFWTQGRFVDGFFNNVIDKIKIAEREAKKPLTEFQIKKANEIKRKAAEEAEKNRLEAEKHANAGAALEHGGMHAAAGIAFAESEAYEQRADHAESTIQAKPNQLVQTRTSSGAVASVRTKIVGEVIDRNILDLETLRPYLHIDALNQAVSQFVKNGGKVLKGAEIKEVQTVGVR